MGDPGVGVDRYMRFFFSIRSVGVFAFLLCHMSFACGNCCRLFLVRALFVGGS